MFRLSYVQHRIKALTLEHTEKKEKKDWYGKSMEDKIPLFLKKSLGNNRSKDNKEII